MGEFTEHLPVSVLEPLHQGDVLEATDEHASMWNRHLMVITADCDLAFGKHLGRVTCVPFLSSDEYVRDIHFARQRDQTAQSLIERLLAVSSNRSLQSITEARLREWLLEGSIQDVIAVINPSPSEQSEVHTIVTEYRRIHVEWKSVSEAREILVSAKLAANPAKKASGVENEIRNQIGSAFKSTPGDALFISSIGPGYQAGYFAYLRHHELVWQHEIALLASRQATPYRRIARLQDRYVHALVQRFATVFMSIGLPDQYEAERDRYSSLMMENAV